MISEQCNKILCRVRQSSNLIHCITNPISINLLANSILALGCRPIMAEHPMEVEEISRNASAVLLNTGNITDVRINSMRKASETANAENIPLILDVAGISCSTFRHGFVCELLENYNFALVKGNYAEIISLAHPECRTDGVDSGAFDDIYSVGRICADLSEKYGTRILATGKTDIVSDGRKCIYVYGGDPMLSKVTGTGCLAGAICACFLSVENSLMSVAEACAFIGACAEISEKGRGFATFALEFSDNISKMTSERFYGMIKMEETIL